MSKYHYLQSGFRVLHSFLRLRMAAVILQDNSHRYTTTQSYTLLNKVKFWN